MSINKLLAPLILVAALGGASWAPTSEARVNVDVDVRVAPPALRAERVPSLHRGYVWVPGYWRWNGHRHVWVAGYRLRERSGRHYFPARWEQRGPAWHFHPGYWDR
ncbi:MAG: YXWGXW repeat-containing protein [Tahibacter sp.]